jgi:hypothetical protein
MSTEPRHHHLSGGRDRSWAWAWLHRHWTPNPPKGDGVAERRSRLRAERASAVATWSAPR